MTEERVGLAAALVLAAVLAWAAVAKARRHEVVVRSFAALRLPAPSLLAVAVPVAEAITAGGLVLWPKLAAWAALVMLLAFTVVLARSLAHGDDAGCACFGAASATRRVSGRDLVRNAALGGLAILATGAPPGIVL